MDIHWGRQGKHIPEKTDIEIGLLRSSSQVALLGVISPKTLGVCFDLKQETIEMKVFAEGYLSEDEKEAFDVATTEIMADILPITPVEAKYIEGTRSPLEKSTGIWVFIRYGCQVKL